MLVTVIGRGHGGTRAISHTLRESGVYMGENLNPSGDLIPAEEMYEACRIMARHVEYLGDLRWDFSRLHTGPVDRGFVRLVESYLSSVLGSKAPHRGWKLPETTLVFPWIVRLFPEAHYIIWTRDPRDSILGAHLTDELSAFGVPCELPDDIFVRRAISWKYQREIIKATPRPRRAIDVRFEDFVLDQERTLAALECFLGIPLARIAVNPEAVGRWKTAAQRPVIPFLADDIAELGYEPDVTPRG